MAFAVAEENSVTTNPQPIISLQSVPQCANIALFLRKFRQRLFDGLALLQRQTTIVHPNLLTNLDAIVHSGNSSASNTLPRPASASRMAFIAFWSVKISIVSTISLNRSGLSTYATGFWWRVMVASLPCSTVRTIPAISRWASLIVYILFTKKGIQFPSLNVKIWDDDPYSSSGKIIYTTNACLFRHFPICVH